jgi:hypothetical protein
MHSLNHTLKLRNSPQFRTKFQNVHLVAPVSPHLLYCFVRHICTSVRNLVVQRLVPTDGWRNTLFALRVTHLKFCVIFISWTANTKLQWKYGALPAPPLQSGKFSQKYIRAERNSLQLLWADTSGNIAICCSRCRYDCVKVICEDGKSVSVRTVPLYF